MKSPKVVSLCKGGENEKVSVQSHKKQDNTPEPA